MAITDKLQSQTVNDLLTIENSNNGITSVKKDIVTGNGNVSSASVSTNVFNVQPQATDTTSAFKVSNKAGTHLLSVNSSNNQVLGGINSVPVNRNEVTFNSNSGNTFWLGASAETWYPLNLFGNDPAGALPTFGTTSGSPDTSYTISTTGHQLPLQMYVLNKAIYLDDVTILASGDATATESLQIYLMSYDIITATGNTEGDLSNGVENADTTVTVTGGYARINYQTATINTALIDASSTPKILMCMVRMSAVVNDFSINVKVGYHYY